MPEPSAAASARAQAAIERYLEQHPGAADSAAGIAQWWLPAQGEEMPLAVVEGALLQLAMQGRVHRQELPGEQVLWRAPR